jgi:hypothetical protein
VIGLLVLLLLPCVTADGDTPAENAPPSDPEVERWLNGPDRHDFDWKVRILDPWLTFQQRYVVETRIVLPVRKLVRAGISFSDFHFAVKVKDAKGQWLPGEYHTVIAPPPQMETAREILLFTHFLLRPGQYTVVVTAYDRRNRRGNVWRRELHVARATGDPLPEIGRNLPDVEFPWGSDARPSVARPARLYLPVRTQGPIQLDVVVNLSLSDATNTRHAQAPDWVYRTNAGILLQIGKVLSQFDLREGCVQFSAIDILRQKVFADRIPAPQMNWGGTIRSVEALQRNKIDVRVLQEQKTTPALFAKFLERLSADPASCGPSTQKPKHVLVVVSDAFLFPLKTEMTAVRSERMPETMCYYLKIDPVFGGNWDQIGRVLSPLHPRHWEFSNAARFRKVLAELIANLESLPAAAASSHSRP